MHYSPVKDDLRQWEMVWTSFWLARHSKQQRVCQAGISRIQPPDLATAHRSCLPRGLDRPLIRQDFIQRLSDNKSIFFQRTVYIGPSKTTLTSITGHNLLPNKQVSFSVISSPPNPTLCDLTVLLPNPSNLKLDGEAMWIFRETVDATQKSEKYTSPSIRLGCVHWLICTVSL